MVDRSENSSTTQTPEDAAAIAKGPRDPVGASTDKDPDKNLEMDHGTNTGSNGRKPESGEPKKNFFPPWAPRLWNGMRLGEFFQLLSEGNYRVSLTRVPSLIPISACAAIGSALTQIQRFRYRKKIEKTELAAPPIFIVGHWRTGTTLLHELMGHDSRLGFPTTFDCFTPHHFLASRWALYWLVKVLLPRRRPMDNMKLAADAPQECDFALAALSAPTPYRRIAFPNNVDSHLKLLTSECLDPESTEDLREKLIGFYKALTFRDQKQLVLKSPPHTGRVKLLAEWFPDAKFIHLSRHPYSVIPSTIHLWRSLDYFHGFQDPKYDDDELLEFVLSSFEQMYDSYFSNRGTIPPKNLVEMRFEEFVTDPLNAIGDVYERLDLPPFSEAKDAIGANVKSRKKHKMNPRKFDDRIKNAIDQRLSRYMNEFGYAPED